MADKPIAAATTTTTVTFRNENIIDDDDYDHTSSSSENIPKKKIVPGFDISHGPTLEAILMIEKEKQLEQERLEKHQNERFSHIKYFMFAGGILTLAVFSFKNWFPFLKKIII